MLPFQAVAGAWPREEGRVFVSTSATITVPQAALVGRAPLSPEVFLGGLVEYGVTERITFGLDGGHVLGRSGFSGIAFLRFGLNPGSGANRYALHAGLGYDAQPAGIVVRAGAAAGRGFEAFGKNGWAEVDVSMIWRQASADIAYKADLTVGLKHGSRWLGFLQVQSGLYPGDPVYVRVQPTIAYRYGENRHVELGVLAGLAGPETAAVKIGSWLEF